MKMIILDDVNYVAVEMYWVILRGVPSVLTSQ